MRLEDPIDELGARIAVVQFAVEVLMANLLAEMQEGNAAEFRADFIDRLGKCSVVDSPDNDDARLAELARRVEALGTRFIDRAFDRAFK